MKRTQLKNLIALTLALSCLFWAGYMMIPVGHHLMEHGKPSDHSGQHSSAACAWMCATSVFSQTNSPLFDYQILPFLFAISVLLKTPFLKYRGNKLGARSPPF